VSSVLGRPTGDWWARNVGEVGEGTPCSTMDAGEGSSSVGQTETEPSVWPVAYSRPFGAMSNDVIARGCQKRRDTSVRE
jgi:hypothetical protein